MGTQFDSSNIFSPRTEDAHHWQHVPSSYEKIQIVGSFGSAILYRRRDDDSLVILKEINLHELSSSGRQLALNEVYLLSRLHHPYIISYYDSFEENGILMIEMEYANGGTLAQFLLRQTEFLLEPMITFTFEQMSCAVSYLHNNYIIHRDLKTANIFLTVDNMVKIGDFGISKSMNTKFQGARTILGTPYYLSPEMCKGQSYNEKSDIWALGCCLYEMICLRKTFDAASLPLLVNKIVNAEYEQIKGPYSNQLKILIRDMLKIKPEQRPTADRVHEIIQRHQNQFLKAKKNDFFYDTQVLNKINTNNESNNIEMSKQKNNNKQNVYSTIYSFDKENVTLSVVPAMPINVKLVIGTFHQLIITSDFFVYSWGNNNFGQLGHGDKKQKNIPTQIECLADRTITKVAVGNSYSLFCTNQGILMGCGKTNFMLDDKITANNWLKPKIIDSLLRENIVDLASGTEHIVVLCENGQVLAWGNGTDGQLGTGNCKCVYQPTKIEILTRELISSVKCGPDCTVFITSQGTVIATGSNRHNKLGLNRRIGFFANVQDNIQKQSEIQNILKPTALKPFNSRVIDVSMGINHTGVLLENGHIHLFGRNLNGELGIGNKNIGNGCKPVKALLHKICLHLICGDGFTMAATTDNELYFWGEKSSIISTLQNTVIKETENPFCQNINDINKFKKNIKLKLNTLNEIIFKTLQSNLNNISYPTTSSQVENSITIMQPTLVLRLDVKRSNSASNLKQSLYIKLTSLACNRKTIMMVVDTSIIYPQKNNKKLNNVNKEIDLSLKRHSAPETSTETIDSSIASWIYHNCKDGKYSEDKFNKILNSTKLIYTLKNEENKKKLITEIENFKQVITKTKNSNVSINQDKLNFLQQKMAKLQTMEDNHNLIQQTDLSVKPKTIKNLFLTETQTKICNIL